MDSLSEYYKEQNEKLRYDIVFSPDDKGYYAEVFNATTGKTVYETPVLDSQQAVETHLEVWKSKR